VPLPPNHSSSREKDIRTLMFGLLALLLSGSAAGHKIGLALHELVGAAKERSDSSSQPSNAGRKAQA
jgi:hypothetical protein